MTPRSRSSRLDALVEAFRRRPALLRFVSSVGLGATLHAALNREVPE